MILGTIPVLIHRCRCSDSHEAGQHDLGGVGEPHANTIRGRHEVSVEIWWLAVAAKVPGGIEVDDDRLYCFRAPRTWIREKRGSAATGASGEAVASSGWAFATSGDMDSLPSPLATATN